MAVAPPLGSVMPPATNDILASQLAALENKRKEMEERDSFGSHSSPSAAITAASLSERKSGSFGSITPGRLSFPMRSSPSSKTKMRPRGFASPPADSINRFMPESLTKLGSAGKPMAGPESFAAFASTRLIVAPATKPKLKLVLGNDEERKGEPLDHSSPKINGVRNVIGINKLDKLTGAFASPEPVTTPNISQAVSPTATRPTTSPSEAQQYYQETIRTAAGESDKVAAPSRPVGMDAFPKLTKEGYTCTPCISTLRAMDPSDLAAVKHFSVEREGVGKVEWEGAVDVRFADLDRIILIEPKSVSVYTEEEEMGIKPEVGVKLNRPAVLTLEGVFPPDGGPEVVEKFKRKVAKQTLKLKAELVDYDPDSGIWKLRVNHFSKYALDLDGDSDDDVAEVKPLAATVNLQTKRKVDFRYGERGRSPGTQKKIREDTPYKPRQPLWDDENVIVSDTEITDDVAVLTIANVAYKNWQLHLAKEDALMQNQNVEVQLELFPEEASFSKSSASTKIAKRYRPRLLDVSYASTARTSIISKLFGKLPKNTTSSNFEFGQRMGKSFRVGWGPDGSFLSIGRNGTIIRSKPRFEENCSAEHAALLTSHRLNSHQVSLGHKVFLLSIASESPGISVAKVLDSYIRSMREMSTTAGKAFSVLKVVMETHEVKSSNPSAYSEIDSMCLFAFSKLIVSSCSDDVRAELASKGQPHDFKSLLAATSSGDRYLASKVASEMGLHRLAILLASSSVSRSSILKDMLSWKNVPEDLKRCYRIIVGDLSMETNSNFASIDAFDWKRHMAMLLTFTKDKSLDMHTFLALYEQRVSTGTAPFPSPKYVGSQSGKFVECVLFKLLKLESASSDADIKFTYFIDPRGYSPNPHDFALAFHLASIICAMPGQPCLTLEQELTLIDGYVAQLVSKGLWEWGVYVLLCSIGLDNRTLSQLSGRFRTAKSLIGQHFRSSNADKRNFLLSVGVPEEYFQEALARRYMVEGNIGFYIKHIASAGKTEEARQAFELTLLPSSLFVDNRKLDDILLLSDAFAFGDNCLAAVLPDLVRIAEKLRSLANESREEIDGTIPKLLGLLDSSEATLLKYKSCERACMGNGFDLFPEDYRVPLGAFIVKALNDVTHLRLQIMSIQEEISGKTTSDMLLKLVREKHDLETAETFQRHLL
jgi:hypothetical protein